MRHRLPPLRLVAALFGAALGVGVGSAPAQAQANGAGWTASDEDSLILELRSGQYKLGEPMRGYQIPGGACVDLADLIQALGQPGELELQRIRHGRGGVLVGHRSAERFIARVTVGSNRRISDSPP